jgi:hypothetical protein
VILFFVPYGVLCIPSVWAFMSSWFILVILEIAVEESCVQAADLLSDIASCYHE